MPTALVTARLTDASYAAGWTVVRSLPEGAARRLFAATADLATRRGGKGIDRLRSNLARVAPAADSDELTAAAVRSYARYWLEVFRLPEIPAARLLSQTQVENDERLREAVAAGRGVILALPHSGNWDAAGAWLTATGVPFTTVAERLRPESLFDRFAAFRASLGMEVLALTGGPRAPFDVLIERLGGGGTVCLLADRDLTPRGVDVQFFGATARMPAGPAALARRTGAVLLPVHLAFRPDGWLVSFGPAVPPGEVPAMTQALADSFATGIARDPADWHMLQRLWLDDLDPRGKPG